VWGPAGPFGPFSPGRFAPGVDPVGIEGARDVSRIPG
jgi:hypothetical protein